MQLAIVAMTRIKNELYNLAGDQFGLRREVRERLQQMGGRLAIECELLQGSGREELRRVSPQDNALTAMRING